MFKTTGRFIFNVLSFSSVLVDKDNQCPPEGCLVGGSRLAGQGDEVPGRVVLPIDEKVVALRALVLVGEGLSWHLEELQQSARESLGVTL